MFSHSYSPTCAQATLNGHLDLIQWLANLPGVDICRTNEQGCTPFYAGCWNGHIEVIAWIAERHPEMLEQPNNANCTPFYAVWSSVHVSCMPLYT